MERLLRKNMGNQWEMHGNRGGDIGVPWKSVEAHGTSTRNPSKPLGRPLGRIPETHGRPTHRSPCQRSANGRPPETMEANQKFIEVNGSAREIHGTPMGDSR